MDNFIGIDFEKGTETNLGATLDEVGTRFGIPSGTFSPANMGHAFTLLFRAVFMAGYSRLEVRDEGGKKNRVIFG